MGHKQIHHLLACLFILYSLAGANSNFWEIQNPPLSGRTFRNISLGPDSTLWILGEYGTILYSNDKGTTWSKSSVSTNSPLTSIAFATKDTGWAVGGVWGNYECLGTTDGGKTWTLSHSFEKPTRNWKVYCKTAQEIWFAGTGHNSQALVWNPSLDKWSHRDVGGERIYDILFLSDSVGIAVGDSENKGYIGRSEDGGISWQKVIVDQQYSSVTGLFFPCKDTGYAIARFKWFEHILRTVDKGKTWQSCLKKENYNINALACENANRVIVLGKTTNFRPQRKNLDITADGGKSWTTLPLPAFGLLADFQLTGSSKGIAICKNSAIYEISIQNLDNIEYSQKTENNGWMLEAVDGYNERNILACGNSPFNPLALITTNGGKTWSPFSIPGEAEGVLYFKKGCLVLFANNGIYRTVNGGDTWTSEVSRGSLEDYSKFGSNFAVVLVGRRPYTNPIVTRDAGQTWVSTISPFQNIDATATGTHLFDNSTIWICSRRGAVAKSEDMGNTWEVLNTKRLVLEESLTNEEGRISTIFFLSDSVGFLGGGYEEKNDSRQPHILRTTDGGRTWESITDLSFKNIDPFDDDDEMNRSITHIVGSKSGNVLYAMAGYKHILRSGDTGQTWKEQLYPQYKTYFRDIYFHESGTMWFAGKNFTIIRTVDSENAKINAPPRVFKNIFQQNPLFPKTPHYIYTLTGRRVQSRSKSSRLSNQFFIEQDHLGKNVRKVIHFHSKTTSQNQ